MTDPAEIQRRVEEGAVERPAEIRRRVEGCEIESRLCSACGRDEALLVARLRDAEQRAERLVDAIRDIDAHATPFGLADPEDPDGNPHHYVLTIGALHRALGAAEVAGMLAGAEQRRAEPATVDDPAEVRRRVEELAGERLAEIEARLAEITPPPWEWSVADDCLTADAVQPWSAVIRPDGLPIHVVVRYERDRPFIQHAPDDVAWLVARLRDAAQQAERAEAERDRLAAQPKAAAMQRDAYRRIREEAEYWATRAAELHERVMEMLEAESGRQACGLLEAGQRAAVLQAERDQARALARWLVALDEPDSAERRTVTLGQIIDRARAVLAMPAAQEGHSPYTRPVTFSPGSDESWDDDGEAER